MAFRLKSQHQSKSNKSNRMNKSKKNKTRQVAGKTNISDKWLYPMTDIDFSLNINNLATMAYNSIYYPTDVARPIYASPDEGITVYRNIPHIVWSSLNIYPEITKLFNNLDLTYLNGFDPNFGILTHYGLIRRIEFSRKIRSSDIENEEDTYTIYGIAKYNRITKADNLLGEYIAGVTCMNALSKKFPIFITTHGLYLVDSTLQKIITKSIQLTRDDVVSHLTPLSIANYSKGCKNNGNVCLVIQYCHNMITLSNPNKILNFDLEIGFILFQVYYALSQCKDVFTHYDLHTDNCGVIPLPYKTCITYEYHTINEFGIPTVIRFRSKYIVKIIDYGRSYFSGIDSNGNSITSENVFTTVSSTRACQPPSEYGFGTVNLKEDHITPNIPNPSHDLRLLSMLLMDPVWASIPYVDGLRFTVTYDKLYGTPNIPSSNSIFINTVDDAARIFARLITTGWPDKVSGISPVNASFILYGSHKSIGTLKVFGLSNDMQFVPNLE